MPLLSQLHRIQDPSLAVLLTQCSFTLEIQWNLELLSLFPKYQNYSEKLWVISQEFYLGSKKLKSHLISSKVSLLLMMPISLSLRLKMRLAYQVGLNLHVIKNTQSSSSMVISIGVPKLSQMKIHYRKKKTKTNLRKKKLSQKLKRRNPKKSRKLLKNSAFLRTSISKFAKVNL